MRNLVKKLWADDAGIVTLEYLVLATVLALALIVGVAAVAESLKSELVELASAIGALDQSYSFAGNSATYGDCVVGSKNGTEFTDTAPEQAQLTINEVGAGANTPSATLPIVCVPVSNGEVPVDPEE